MNRQYTYIIYTQIVDKPIKPIDVGSIKGFANNEEDARKITQEILLREFSFDIKPIHASIIRYENGPLTHNIWTLDCFQSDTTNHLLASYEIDNGFITEQNANISNLNNINDKCIIM